MENELGNLIQLQTGKEPLLGSREGLEKMTGSCFPYLFKRAGCLGINTAQQNGENHPFPTTNVEVNKGGLRMSFVIQKKPLKFEPWQRDSHRTTPHSLVISNHRGKGASTISRLNPALDSKSLPIL